ADRRPDRASVGHPTSLAAADGIRAARRLPGRSVAIGPQGARPPPWPLRPATKSLPHARQHPAAVRRPDDRHLRRIRGRRDLAPREGTPARLAPAAEAGCARARCVHRALGGRRRQRLPRRHRCPAALPTRQSVARRDRDSDRYRTCGRVVSRPGHDALAERRSPDGDRRRGRRTLGPPAPPASADLRGALWVGMALRPGDAAARLLRGWGGRVVDPRQPHDAPPARRDVPLAGRGTRRRGGVVVDRSGGDGSDRWCPVLGGARIRDRAPAV
ncbi:MAG: hypothetical protein AVDCRST_MAG59-1903, partial [uncultured Thermomicrobiales bacterium]